MWTRRWWCQALGELFHLTLEPGARGPGRGRRHGLWPSPCCLHPPAQGWPLLEPGAWGLGPGVGVIAVSLAWVWAAHSGVGVGPWVGAECSSPPELGAGPADCSSRHAAAGGGSGGTCQRDELLRDGRTHCRRGRVLAPTPLLGPPPVQHSLEQGLAVPWWLL